MAILDSASIAVRHRTYPLGGKDCLTDVVMVVAYLCPCPYLYLGRLTVAAVAAVVAVAVSDPVYC